MTTTRKLSAALVSAVVAGLLATLAILTMTASKQGQTHTATVSASPVSQIHAVPTVTAGCTVSTPTSAAGYSIMFASLNPAEWGGADGALSVKMPNGLVVWLYSDTLSTGRFVHNSLIVQDKGCLHVSNAGAQLIPNENSKLIYWVDSARVTATGRLLVRMQQIAIGSNGTWDFHATGLYRTATVTLDSKHNASFVWSSSDRNGATKFPYTKNIVQCAVRHDGTALTYPTKSQLCSGSGEYSYNPQAHSWAKLASGKLLLTVCYNNADALTHFDHYRPKFFEIGA